MSIQDSGMWLLFPEVYSSLSVAQGSRFGVAEM
jgi:hypothetical protein